MRIFVIILGTLCTVIGLVMSILPFGSLAFLPLLAAIILGFIAYRMSKKESKPTAYLKVILLITLVGVALATFNVLFVTNTVANEGENIEQEEQSLEDAKEELEDIEID